MAAMLMAREIGLKHKADAHGVAAGGRGVYGGAERAVQLEFLRLNGDDLQNRKLLGQLLGQRWRQRIGGEVPRGALQVETGDIAAGLQALIDGAGINVRRDGRVQSRPVKRPAMLATWAISGMGDEYSLQVVWTSAVRYDSGMWRPDSHMTMGSPCLHHESYCTVSIRIRIGTVPAGDGVRSVESNCPET
jgi:hypothetical protein